MLPRMGLENKVVELQLPNKFVDAPDAEDKRQKQADPQLAVRAQNGDFRHELIAWCKCLQHTLGPDVLKGRILLLQPASVKIVQKSKDELVVNVAVN